MTQLEETATAPAADAQQEIRAYWDVDAATYDLSPHHRPRSSAEQAAWAATLARVLPPPPARVLDVGAGTGFLSLLAAGLGHRGHRPRPVARHARPSRREGRGGGPRRHDQRGPCRTAPGGALRRRRRTSPAVDAARSRGHARRLAAGGTGGATGRLRGAVGGRWRARARRCATGSASGCGGCGASRPTTTAATTRRFASSCRSAPARRPKQVVELVEAAGWPGVRLERLADVEWATRRSLRTGPSGRWA